MHLEAISGISSLPGPHQVRAETRPDPWSVVGEMLDHGINMAIVFDTPRGYALHTRR